MEKGGKAIVSLRSPKSLKNRVFCLKMDSISDNIDPIAIFLRLLFLSKTKVLTVFFKLPFKISLYHST